MQFFVIINLKLVLLFGFIVATKGIEEFYFSSGEINLTRIYVDGEEYFWIKCASRIHGASYVPYHSISKAAENASHLKEKMSVLRLGISRCVLTMTPLVEMLEDMNINTSSIQALHLSDVIPRILDARDASADETPKISKSLLGLNIYNLTLTSSNIFDVAYIDTKQYISIYTHTYVCTELIRPLLNLTKLTLVNVRLSTLLQHKLTHIILKDGAWINTLDNCQYLEDLTFQPGVPYNNVVNKNWAKNCSKLKSLTFVKIYDNIYIGQILKRTRKSWSNLSSFTIKDCKITRLPHNIFKETKQLKHLDLSKNELTNDALKNLPVMPVLTYLNLADNFMTDNFASFILILTAKLPSLRTVILDRNKLETFDEIIHELYEPVLPDSLIIEVLSLHDNPLVSENLDGISFAVLKHLNLSLSDQQKRSNYPDVEYFSLLDLPITNASYLEIDLRGRFLDVTFSHREYLSLRQRSSKYLHPVANLTLLLDDVDCDCRYYWLALALREFANAAHLPKFPNLTCKSGTAISKETLEKMNCTKIMCPNMIVRKWEKRTTIDWDRSKKFVNWSEIEDCVKDLPSPQYLNVSDTNITSLEHAYLPNTIQTLDLRNNELTLLSPQELATLFGSPARRVWLGGNHFTCDCGNEHLLYKFHKHKYQIEDFYDIKCLNSGELLHTVTPFKTCLWKYSMIISNSLLALVMMTATVLWWYRFHIQMYLIARGWCLFCLSEEDVDADRPYDAFLSFSHGDEEYVTQHLLPKLESKPYCYKICVHYRDWIAGGWIPTQIMRSVSQSERVIIVLSRNFVESLWASMEFKFAMTGTAERSGYRVIVLVLDDVLSQPLEVELRDYLTFNTYMRCDDPWFWERLCYAMPRRKLPTDKLKEAVRAD